MVECQLPKLKVAGSTPVSRSSASMYTPRPVSGGPGSLPAFDLPEGVSSLGHGFAASGEIRAAEHLIVEGNFDGRIFIPDHDVAIGRRGRQSGELLAQENHRARPGDRHDWSRIESRLRRGRPSKPRSSPRGS